MDKEYFKTECIKIKNLPQSEQEQAKDKLMDKISDAIYSTDSDEILDQLKEFGEVLHKFTKFLNEKPKEFAKKFAVAKEKADEYEEQSQKLKSTIYDLKIRLRDLEDEKVRLEAHRTYWQSHHKILQETKELLES